MLEQTSHSKVCPCWCRVRQPRCPTLANSSRISSIRVSSQKVAPPISQHGIRTFVEGHYAPYEMKADGRMTASPTGKRCRGCLHVGLPRSRSGDEFCDWMRTTDGHSRDIFRVWPTWANLHDMDLQGCLSIRRFSCNAQLELPGSELPLGDHLTTKHTNAHNQFEASTRPPNSS